jgi:serine/threonine protein kinase
MNSRVESLFHEVADLQADARRHYFAEHSVDDETRREVERLIEFDAEATDFLERGISAAATEALPHLDAREKRCGPYRLLKIVGLGGMGAVYLAERVDGEVAQRVAIKLLPPGAGDIQRERFLQERQILASLVHPNIARMFDAGHTDNGQPFLAMEYVEGQPIDTFAAQLGVRQKIGLFLKVCAATGYLHRNLVVHRDLKPSNILVTADGDPKLLDFGIAKVLDVTSDATLTHMRMLTPSYASPEQVSGGFVSTATDIYSMGAVLYKLLTGKPAHEFEEHTPEAISAVVTRREVTRPTRWAPELKGDLEAILLKALRKDPQERYLTTEQFAEDLQAYLDSRPVRARSGNNWYRARKFLRRYWMPVFAAGLVIASLSAGLYVAERQRAIAQRRFMQVRQIANDFLDLDRSIQNLPGATAARDQIVSKSLAYLSALGAEAQGDRTLSIEIANAYLHVGRVQGVAANSNLGRTNDAEVSLSKAAAYADSVLQSDPNDRVALRTSAEISHDRMIVAQTSSRMGDMIVHARKTADRLDQLRALGNLSSDDIVEITRLLSNVANGFNDGGFFNEASQFAQRSVEAGGNEPQAQRLIGIAWSVLALARRSLGDLDGALDAIRNAKQTVQKAAYSTEMLRATALHTIFYREGLILGREESLSLNRPAEAIESFQKSYDQMAQIAARDPRDARSRRLASNAALQMGWILTRRDPEGALVQFSNCVSMLEGVAKSAGTRIDEARCLAASTYSVITLHRIAEAGVRLDSAMALLREAKAYPAERVAIDEQVAVVLRARANYLGAIGEQTQSAGAYRELLAKVLASKPAPQTNLGDANELSALYDALVRACRTAGDRTEAETIEEKRLNLWKDWDRRLPNNPFVHRRLAAITTKP